MSLPKSSFLTLFFAIITIFIVSAPTYAQETFLDDDGIPRKRRPGTGGNNVTGGIPEGSVKMVIKRDAIYLISPDEFREPISLKPIRELELRALVEGIVKNVRVETGAKVSQQEEVLRIDSAAANKLLERAKANLKVASIRRDIARNQKQAGEQTEANLELAEAELDVAEADLDLAQLQFDQTSLRAPFAGEVTSVVAIEGAFVKEGDLLMKLRDTSQLTVHVPVDRGEIKEGDNLTITLDNGKATGTIKTILPLSNEWQALRQIVETAAIAVVIIDNKSGQYQDGQTAYSDIVPRLPVIEVANTSLKNSETGNRMVQVIRDSIVRDLEVELLGAVGEDRSYITGPFQANDELITESSQPLLDGTVVLPANPAVPRPQTPSGQGNQQPTGRPGV